MPKIAAKVKLQLPAGKATPAPPVGTSLGSHGINLQNFVNQFNDMTRALGGDIVPVVVTIYEDRSFSLELKTPPAADLLRKAAGADKGSATPNLTKVGKVTKAQVREIAERKMKDLSARDVEAAMKIVEGTARSMGITVEG